MREEFSNSNKSNTAREIIEALAARLPNDNQGNFFSKLTRSELTKEFYRLITTLNNDYDESDSYYELCVKLDTFIEKQKKYLEVANIGERIEVGLFTKQRPKP